MELGARKFDFIGMKFQIADEITEAYTHALATAATWWAMSEIVTDKVSS